MHIVEVYFESGGFDFKLLKGGISVYMWNLSRKFVAAGHKVSLVTATNGRLDYLQQHYQLERLDWRHDYVLPLALDPLVWDARTEAEVPLSTSVYKMTLEGIDVYFLDNEMLRLYPDTCYPPYQVKGSELGFYKPLAFQVDCIEFIEHQFGGEKILVHAHEPYYQYLLPIAFRDDADKVMVSTVQSNMPINKKIYKPKLARLLELLGVQMDLDQFDDRIDKSDPLVQCMEQTLPVTHLYYPYRDDYINLLAPILEYSDFVDFLSPGQLRFYASFADTPFEQLYGQLKIADVVRRNAHKLFVGWCAISDNWHNFDPSTVDRAEVLSGLGLDPALPTFYHNARYAVEHKGQVELMRAIDQVLAQGHKVNFIVRCMSGTGIDNPYFHEVKARYPANIHLDWRMVSEATLMRYASAADFSLFPSKFEMDTFLIAQGEAMLLGAVPIATAQEGTAHFDHALPLSDAGATGLAVNRSFAEDDALLAQALAARIAEAAQLYRDDQPRYAELAANARAVASRFTWDMAARAHLDVFERAAFERYQGAPAQDKPAQRSIEIGAGAVRYSVPGAAGVSLFSQDGARFARVPMQAAGGGFVADLAQADGELFFQVTLDNGRVYWDRSGHAAH
jgi:glycosyltransferase involved in cell wall biosynthesis